MSKVLLNNKWFDTEDIDYQNKITDELIKSGCSEKDIIYIDGKRLASYNDIISSRYPRNSTVTICGKPIKGLSHQNMLNHFIKIDSCWWRIADSVLFCKPGNIVRVENRDGGYHYHKIEYSDEIKRFENPMDAWLENDQIEEVEYNVKNHPEESLEITSLDYINKHGKLEGYITREGRFIDVSNYNDASTPSAHQVYCDEHGFDEEQMLKEEQWVKISKVLPDSYIFYGMRLSPEQIHVLEEMGYEIDELDK